MPVLKLSRQRSSSASRRGLKRGAGRERSVRRLCPVDRRFRSQEKKIVQLSAEITTSRAVAEKDLKQREAKALVAVYQDAKEAIRVVAEQNGYTLVLRIDRDAIAAKNYATIQQTMGQLVLRHDSREDITDAVIEHLNSQYESAAGGSAKGGTGLAKPASDKAASTACR